MQMICCRLPNFAFKYTLPTGRKKKKKKTTHEMGFILYDDYYYDVAIERQYLTPHPIIMKKAR
jgi:hypothetical protein